jgi:hypothetical protein
MTAYLDDIDIHHCYCRDGLRLCLCGTAAANGPSTRWHMSEYKVAVVWYWQGKTNNSEKTCPSATLSITSPTWTDLGANPGLRGEKPATNRLSGRHTSHLNKQLKDKERGVVSCTLTDKRVGLLSHSKLVSYTRVRNGNSSDTSGQPIDS